MHNIPSFPLKFEDWLPCTSGFTSVKVKYTNLEPYRRPIILTLDDLQTLT